MNITSFLDELLKAGRELADKGQTIAEDTLNLGGSEEKRDATLSGMKTGALAAGAIALLLGTNAGRRVTGSALKIGSLAAVGGVAWKAYQNYVANNDVTNTSDVVPVSELDDEEADKRSVTLLKA